MHMRGGRGGGEGGGGKIVMRYEDLFFASYFHSFCNTKTKASGGVYRRKIS